MIDNDIKKALDILKEWQTLAYHNDDGTDEDSHELYWALAIVFKHISRQNAEIERLQKFKSYFDELYGEGLEVANWHLNGDLEPFDNFYESALEV